MRRFVPRPALDPGTVAILAAKKEEIVQIEDAEQKRARARQIFNNARDSQWFSPLRTALKHICGPCDVCMYCSANEPSQIEHYRPISSFPEQALDYHNYLWTCDVCNRSYKGCRFPPVTEPGEQILNPIDDYVWDYFILDEKYGRLVKRIDPVTELALPRAVSTCDVVGIDRDGVQQRRTKRYAALKRDVLNSIAELQAGQISIDDARARLETWLNEPFQADVADYFLDGPGKTKEPFRAFVAALQR